MRIAIVALLLALTSCGTMFGQGDHPVSVTTRPPGATVLLDGNPVGTTPCQVVVPREADGLFTFQLAGFVEGSHQLVQKGEPWFYGNLVFAIGFVGLITAGIDVLCDHTMRWAEDAVEFELDPVTTPPHSSPAQPSRTPQAPPG